MMEENNTSPSSLQDKKETMETSYVCVVPETLKMINDFLELLIGTASVEQSFKSDKNKTTQSPIRLCVAQLMRISIEGPEIDTGELEEGLEICKEHNHRILL